MTIASIPAILQQLGEYRLVAIVGLIAVGAFITGRILHWGLNLYFKRASTHLRVDPTNYRFFKNTVTFLVVTIAIFLIIYAIPSLRSLAITLFAGAGILVAILGLAAQQAFSNIISGIFIVIFRPFRVDDIIRVGTLYSGTVEDITLRHTVIRDFTNQRIIIPNSVISSEVLTNSTITDQETCAFIEVGISYDSDVDKAMAIMADEANRHADRLDHRTDEEKADGEPIVPVRLIAFGESSVNLRAYVWGQDAVTTRMMHYDLNKSIKARFDREGIEIPFPHRTVILKNAPKADGQNKEGKA